MINEKELAEIYETGSGKIKIRGKAEIERGKKKGDKDLDYYHRDPIHHDRL